MKANVINFIERAYNCDNPIQSLESVPVTLDMLDLLLPAKLDLSSKYPPNILCDILSHRSQTAVSDVALQCKFAYFATSMIILWEMLPTQIIDELAQNIVALAIHSPRSAPRRGSSLGMVSYIEPNKPIPHVWLNVQSKGTVDLCKFGGRNFPARFRVILHVMRRVNEIETLKLTFDTTSNHKDPIPFSQGSAVQLALRLDLDVPCAEFVKPNPDFDCVVYLTLDSGVKGSVYHKTKDRLIHTLIA
jgi:hypothetical protein